MKKALLIYPAVAVCFAVVAVTSHADEQPRFRGYYSGVTKPGEQVIDNLKAWQKVWNEVHKTVNPQPKLPPVDFTKQIVLAVFMGQQNTGGYQIEITGVKQTDKAVVVSVRTTSPPPDSFTTQALTQPYDLLVVKNPTKPVKFVIHGKSK
ncbi:MAG: protease complex subunit PrcB family protein [Planctomycetaceae bacterium]|nr:protease complex subunit PrcB family protein [Planctomycetaceae bacterium]